MNIGLESAQIVGVGVDIEQVARFEEKLSDELFLRRIFTQQEIAYCLSKAKPAPHLTARFCAKEATVKALTDVLSTRLVISAVEVINTETGKPEIRVSHPEATRFKLHVSLSHTDMIATAYVLAERA